jgi:tripartite-type tricarboxylate transporter receptor subunit TctC
MKILATLILVLFTNISYASELNIVVASAETDGQTTNARIFGRYLAKYILPDTKLIIRVVPGAAGVNQANHVYNIAPKDGNTISTLLKNIPIVGTIGGPSIQYDARRFFWLGSVADGRKDAVVLVSNKTYDGTELVIGADNVVAADPINFIKNYTNINIRRVSGYPNANSVRLSYQRREIDGFVSNLQGIKLNNPEWIRTENFLVQLGNGFSRHPELPNTPTMSELITNEEGRKLISIFETQFALLRPFVAPPGIPEDKKKILLRAFEMAVKDPEYIKDATKISLNIDPIYSDEAQRIVDSTYSISKELLDKIK